MSLLRDRVDMVSDLDRSPGCMAGPGSATNSIPWEVIMYGRGPTVSRWAVLARAPVDKRLSAGELGREGLKGKTFRSCARFVAGG
mmetsp:Transcript_34081/g.94274  ORF Transcript_34081/g.94274 Transcript_34081/m.94274 type:complete len:85 (-) Transcript_34081:110-364(-)